MVSDKILRVFGLEPCLSLTTARVTDSEAASDLHIQGCCNHAESAIYGYEDLLSNVNCDLISHNDQNILVHWKK